MQDARDGCKGLACATAGCCTRGQLLQTLLVSYMLGAEQEAVSMQAALPCVKVIFKDGISVWHGMQQGEMQQVRLVAGAADAFLLSKGARATAVTELLNTPDLLSADAWC